MRPTSGNVLVRPVETSETYGSGRMIIPDSIRDKLNAGQMEIVAVGQPGRCEEPEECERPHNGECHVIPPVLTVGAWALVMVGRWVEMADDLWLVRQEDVLGVFHG